jgi:hypothetical protein
MPEPELSTSSHPSAEQLYGVSEKLPTTTATATTTIAYFVI